MSKSGRWMAVGSLVAVVRIPYSHTRIHTLTYSHTPLLVNVSVVLLKRLICLRSICISIIFHNDDKGHLFTGGIGDLVSFLFLLYCVLQCCTVFSLCRYLSRDESLSKRSDISLPESHIHSEVVDISLFSLLFFD